jgi:signal transduction histidine kinase
LPRLEVERARELLSADELSEPRAQEAALAPRAGATKLAMLVTAPTRAGRLRVARALHALGGGGGALVVSSGPTLPADPPPAEAAVYADLEALADGDLADGDLLMLDCLLDDGAVWLLAGADPHVALPERLAPRLHVTHVDVPGIDTLDAQALRVLAERVLARLARNAGEPPPVLDDSAVAALRAQRWAGDRIEFEAVLGRGFLLAAGVLSADHLALPVPTSPSPPEPTRASAPAGALTEARLEYLMAILAHELRNPLVTIKTFTSHLPALLDDAELRENFAGLADDAIARMDAALENLVAFTRLGPPRPESVPLQPVLDAVIDELAPQWLERELRPQRVGNAGAACFADPAHLTYGLRNLLSGVAEEANPEDGLVIDTSVNGVVGVRFATGAAASRLRQILAPDGEAALTDPTFLPLSLTLARTVLERSGGSVGVIPEPGDRTSVVLHLPVPPGDSEL